MENFHQEFLVDSVRNLKQLQKKLSKVQKINDTERREIFRTLHTIKGSAQTFGFTNAGKLAHELETLLSAGQVATDEEIKAILFEGITFLADAIKREDFILPTHFVEKIHLIIPPTSQLEATFSVSLTNFPREIVEYLSQTEKVTIDSALKSGKYIYCFEVGFEPASFAEDLIKCRKMLSDTGEIVAMFPSTKFDSAPQIGFKIICASSKEKVRFEELIKPFGAEIVFDVSPEIFKKDLRSVVSKAVAHGREVAEKLGKNSEFEIFVEEIKLSGEKLKQVFDILLHLIRNAADHGIKNDGGKIGVVAKIENEGLFLSVADNGNGINIDKIRVEAIERKIIRADEILDEQATLALIFHSELSTAPKITEFSGRGVGLDAVKYLVEKADGKIEVKSSAGEGTVFEIFLPLKSE